MVRVLAIRQALPELHQILAGTATVQTTAGACQRVNRTGALIHLELITGRLLEALVALRRGPKP